MLRENRPVYGIRKEVEEPKSLVERKKLGITCYMYDEEKYLPWLSMRGAARQRRLGLGKDILTRYMFDTRPTYCSYKVKSTCERGQ